MSLKKPKKMGAPKGHCNRVVHGAYMELSKRHIDGRSTLAKLLKTLKANLRADLGGDVSTAQNIIIDRVAFKCGQVGYFENALATGETRDFKTYLNLTNSLRQDLQAIGLERRERDYLSYLDEVRSTDGAG